MTTRTVTEAYFIDADGNKRDITELSDIIHDVVFAPPTPEQAKAAQEYFDHMRDNGHL